MSIDLTQYRLDHPYYYLYCWNFKFKCEDLDYFETSQEVYDKPYEEVEDNIKTVIKQAIECKLEHQHEINLHVPDGFYYKDDPKRVKITFNDKEHSISGWWKELIINVTYKPFDMKITLIRDRWYDCDRPYCYGDDCYHLGIDMHFPGKEDAYGVVLPLNTTNVVDNVRQAVKVLTAD